MLYLKWLLALVWFFCCLFAWIWHGQEIIETGVGLGIVGGLLMFMLPDLKPLWREFLLVPAQELVHALRS